MAKVVHLRHSCCFHLNRGFNQSCSSYFALNLTLLQKKDASAWEGSLTADTSFFLSCYRILAVCNWNHVCGYWAWKLQTFLQNHSERDLPSSRHHLPLFLLRNMRIWRHCNHDCLISFLKIKEAESEIFWLLLSSVDQALNSYISNNAMCLSLDSTCLVNAHNSTSPVCNTGI